MSKSNKVLDIRVQLYKKKFSDGIERLNLGSGSCYTGLREELERDLEKRLQHTRSKLQSKGRIKTSSNGKKYISFF